MTVRIVTVVFTDLVGSTAMAARLGPDATETLRREHFACLRAGIAGHGGREVKNLGDGLMVVFELGVGGARRRGRDAASDRPPEPSNAGRVSSRCASASRRARPTRSTATTSALRSSRQRGCATAPTAARCWRLRSSRRWRGAPEIELRSLGDARAEGSRPIRSRWSRPCGSRSPPRRCVRVAGPARVSGPPAVRRASRRARTRRPPW